MQYYANRMDNLAPPDAFVEILKMTNHARLWVTDPTWYLSGAVQPIFLFGLERDLEILRFRRTYLCLIVGILQP